MFIGASTVPNISGSTKKTTKIEDVYNKINDEIKTRGTTSINPYRLENPFFDTYEIIDFGQTAWGLSAADFNDDGYVDFAVSSARDGQRLGVRSYTRGASRSWRRALKIHSIRRHYS